MVDQRVLDWRSRHDPASRQYGIVALTGRGVTRRRVMWGRPVDVLDQGREGACVAFGWIHEAMAEPVRVDFAKTDLGPGWPKDPTALALAVYRYCKKIDEWEGEAYDGTSVLAGAKTMRQLGIIKSYRWAFGRQEVTDALLAHGPVVLGIPWYESAYNAPGGEMKLTGKVVGGHCVVAVGYDPTHTFRDGTVGEAFLILNSWSESWGSNGCAWLRATDLDRLLADRGEACVPLTRSFARARVRSAALRVISRLAAGRA